MAGQKTYFCPGYPNGLFGSIKFAGGWYRTSNVFEQRFIEDHPFFKRLGRIKLIGEETLKAIDTADEYRDPETGLVDLRVLDDESINLAADIDEPEILDPSPDPRDVGYTKSQINGMKVAELKELAFELGLDWEGRNATSLKFIIKKELGL